MCIKGKIHYEGIVPWALSSMFGVWCHIKTNWFNRTSNKKKVTCLFCLRKLRNN
jgi:hypothetical protein